VNTTLKPKPSGLAMVRHQSLAASETIRRVEAFRIDADATILPAPSIGGVTNSPTNPRAAVRPRFVDAGFIDAHVVEPPHESSARSIASTGRRWALDRAQARASDRIICAPPSWPTSVCCGT
jgi:hypothetical protein